MAVSSKKAKRGYDWKRSTSKIFVVAVLALCVLLMLKLGLDLRATGLLGLVESISASDASYFYQNEIEARAVQEKFCQDLAAGRIESPKSQQGSLEPMKTKQTRFGINIRGEMQRVVLEIYEGNDIVSNSIGESNGWENEAAKEYITIFEKYAKDHNLLLSDLTFVDIGANVGWFTIGMAAVGVNVIAFEPMEQNLHLIRKTLCNPENSSFSDRVVVFPTGLSDTTQTCILFSDKNNVGDGMTTCVGDLSTFVPQEGYDIRGYIPVDRIDNIVSPATRNIVVVKMDTEGFEPHVLLGGPTFFLQSKIPYIFSEFSPNAMMKSRGGDGRRFMRDMLDAGYAVRFHQSETFLSRESALNMDNFPSIHDLMFEYQPVQQAAV
jgi:FkbM family methyltransferase